MKNKHRKGTLMKEKLGKQILAVLLTFTLCLTSVEWSGIAGMIHSVHAKQTINETSETKKIIEKTTNSTTFQMTGGKKNTIFYGQDVRFETDNGTLEDYDPTLVKVEDSKSENGNSLKDYAYENETGDKKHYLPKKLTDKTPVLMENGKYEISFAPIYGEEKENKDNTDIDNTTDSKDQSDNRTSKAVEQAVAQADQAVRAVTDGTSDDQSADTEATDKDDQEDALTSVKKLTRTGLEEETVEDARGNSEEKQVKVSYESEKKDCTFSYESLNTGVKESIVLTKAPEGNVLKFHFKAKGLTPKKNAMDGGISFLDEETDEIVASLEAPNINDATGKAYSEELYYDIEPDGEEDSYLLTLHLE